MAYRSRFETYFARPVARKAAEPLKDGTEMEFRILSGEVEEIFVFIRSKSGNEIREGGGQQADVSFSMPSAAAEEILEDSSEEIGAIGVAIARKILSDDPELRIKVEIRSGFLTLMRRGYFGVVTSGGRAFAGYLAAKGFNGVSAFKAALKRGKG